MVVAPGDARLGSVGQYNIRRSGLVTLDHGSVAHQCQTGAATDLAVKVDIQNLYCTGPLLNRTCIVQNLYCKVYTCTVLNY